ncbi:MAG TPA: TonB-dependent receptor [Acidobacteriaceae bacterium]|nr:TonB-dependent receptor [Acidobacteriaceae bacterium]
MDVSFRAIKLLSLLAIGTGWSVLAQVNTGELRVAVTDAAGPATHVAVTVSSEGTHYRNTLKTNSSGTIDCKELPFGMYSIQVDRPGFAPATTSADIHSAIPVERSLHLGLAPVTTVVTVSAPNTLIDPYMPSSVMQIGSRQIQDRVASLPGRSVQALVDSQPGWLYEGNVVLHPRGSEYQTQFVINGIPLTDNRSPSFGPEIEANDLSSMSVYTAGFPAEYGRKMGGVVELNTIRDTNPGLHGQLVLSGGSYDTGAAFTELQYLRGKNSFGATGSGSMTDHYLNPVVPENYTNTGTTGDFSGRYERDFSAADRLSLGLRHELSRFLIPNELVQQQAGQRQYGDNFETMGTVHDQHTFSANSIATLAGMVRDNSNDLTSNAASTPIIVFQHNHFREGYFKGTYSLHRGKQEMKAGVESDNTFLNENFHDIIADPSQFDPDTPSTFSFIASRPDLEQSAFLEDLVRLGRWTVSAGLRYDHYQLLLNEFAFSPRLSVGRYFTGPNLMLHFSYDRVFQTPSFENILLSSSPKVDALSKQFLRLPVQPSRGNYYEGGISKAFLARMRVDANLYRRDVRNFADDNQLLNTGISYPIAFDHAVVYGAEGKLELTRLGDFSGFISYSYMVGNVWLPVTGGLFLGPDASSAANQLSGHFPNTQDQRNSVRTRFRDQLSPRFWIAAGADYNSGLPFDYTGTQTEAIAQYGRAVVGRLNFARGRVRPALLFDATAAAELYRNKRFTINLQADGANLSNQLDVIDFGGLFSGNAIGPGRSFNLRLNTTF